MLDGMEVVRWGTGGSPLVYVPSSGGDHREFQRYGMAECCAPWIDSGTVQIFSVDGHGPRGLFDDSMAPAERIAAYAAFERELREETIPEILALAARDGLGVVGASYGAFVAANLWLKRPERVRIGCGLGGVYGMWHRLSGHHDDDVYFHTPLEFLPRLEDPAILAAIRETRGFVLFGAERDEWLPSTHAFTTVLAQKGLPHRTEIWPAPAGHDERIWRLQLRRFLGSELSPAGPGSPRSGP